MSLSKRKSRRDGEGPSRLRRLLDDLVRRFGAEYVESIASSLKVQARSALRRRPRRKRARPNRRSYSSSHTKKGPGRYFPGHIRRKPVLSEHSIDPKWKLNMFQIRERLRLPQDTPAEVVEAAIQQRRERDMQGRRLHEIRGASPKMVVRDD